MTFLPRSTHGRVGLAAAFAVAVLGGFVWAQLGDSSPFTRMAAMIRLPPVDTEDVLPADEGNSLLVDEADVREMEQRRENALHDPSVPHAGGDDLHWAAGEKTPPPAEEVVAPPVAEEMPDAKSVLANPEDDQPSPSDLPSIMPDIAPPMTAPEIAAPALPPLPPAIDMLPPPQFPAIPSVSVNFDVPPWWNDRLDRSFFDPAKSRPLPLPELLMSALFNSQYVKAITLEPLILETEITKNAAVFDPGAYLDSKWQDLNDPVGNTLTTGGANRFLQDDLQNRVGMKQKNSYGGLVEAGQEIGLKNTNSIFFQPGQQGLTRMYVSYNQPLLKGYGQCYNQALIVLAEIDTKASSRDVEKLLADHLQKVIDTYWELCLNRAWYLQRLRARDKGLAILRELEARRDFDVLASQLLRAQAAVATRNASLARAEAGIRNAETRLRTLTNDPALSAVPDLELLPVNTLPLHFQPPNLVYELQTALSHRAEIEVQLELIRGSEVRLGMAQNELRPTLNLVLEAYSRGLDGNFNVVDSFANQFNQGSPSYTTGFVFEAPLGNRAAQSKRRRRELETRQLMHQLQNTLGTVSGEVEIAIRDLEASHREIRGQQRAVAATEAEVNYLLERWRLLPGHDRAAAVILEDALNAQDRLVAAEASLAQSQHDFAVSASALKRANGTLLDLQPGRDVDLSQAVPMHSPQQNVLPPQGPPWQPQMQQMQQMRPPQMQPQRPVPLQTRYQSPQPQMTRLPAVVSEASR